MKKILCVLFAILAATTVFAELNVPHRYFELGVDMDVGLANNWLNMSDFFQETLVLDFTEMASNLKDGFSVDMNANVDAYININIGKKIRMNMFVGVDGMGMVNLSQELLQLVAKGNAEGDHSINAAVGMDLAVYTEAGFSIQAFFGKLGVGVAPSMFIPVVYMPRVDASGSVKIADDGSITGSVGADVSVYSVFPLKDTVFSTASEYLADAGLDFSVSAEYALLPNLDIGVSLTHIPAVAASLRHEMYFTASEVYNTKPIIDSLFDDDSDSETEDTEEKDDADFSINDPEFRELLDPYKLHRPVELNVVAAFRPFEDWFDVKGSVGVVFYEPVYVNFGLEAGLHFINMGKLGGHLIDVALTTGYNERVWTQELSFGVNLRLLELNLSVSSRSTDFIKSFTGNGLGVGLGVKVGF